MRLLGWFAPIRVFLAAFVFFLFFFDVVRLLEWFALIHVFLAEFVVFCFFLHCATSWMVCTDPCIFGRVCGLLFLF